MSGIYSSASRIAASILLICNFIAMLFCLTVFTLSLWLISSPATFVNTIKLFAGPTLKLLVSEDGLSVELGVAAALLAGFFFFISCMGFYGAVTGSQFLLFMYAALVILLLLLECAIMFYISSNLVEKGVPEPNSFVSHVLRATLKCCDQNVTTKSNDVTPPWSCCKVEQESKNCTADRVSPMDCRKAIDNWLTSYQTAVYVSLGVFHVALSACSLVRRGLSASHAHSHAYT